MYRIGLFGEDFGHEAFLSAIVNRFAKEYGVDIKITPNSVRGGHGKVLTELKQYLRDLRRGRVELPELLVVATDANCKGYSQRRSEVAEAAVDSPVAIVHALPDPHIERWLLLDSAAFKKVLGKGCSAPDKKCGRARYKDALLTAMRDTGVSPPLGGIEYTEDIVNAMDLLRMERGDDSLGNLLKDLHSKFKEWSREDLSQ